MHGQKIPGAKPLPVQPVPIPAQPIPGQAHNEFDGPPHAAAPSQVDHAAPDQFDLEGMLAHVGDDARYAERTIQGDPAAWLDRYGIRSERSGLIVTDANGNGSVFMGEPEAGYYWLIESLSAEAQEAGSESVGDDAIVASSGVVANAAAVATIPGISNSLLNFIDGFTISGVGATAGGVATLAVAGLGSALTQYAIGFPAAAAPFSFGERFPKSLPATTPGGSIVLTLPALGAGNTGVSIEAFGYSEDFGTLVDGIVSLYPGAVANSLGRIGSVNVGSNASGGGFRTFERPQVLSKGSPLFAQAFGVSPALSVLGVRVQIRAIPI